MPFGLSADQLGEMISKASATPEWEARERPLEIVLSNDQLMDPIDDPEGTLHQGEKLMAAGATMIQLHLLHRSVDHYVEQLEALAKLLIFEAV